jgi:hypothetical protein
MRFGLHATQRREDEPAMADKRVKRIAELIKPLRYQAMR